MKNNAEFFEQRAESGFGFHYGDKLMDKYAFELRKKVIFSHVDVRDKFVLDIGCGDGTWIDEFNKRGAKYVAGIEQSHRLAGNAYLNVKRKGIESVVNDWDLSELKLVGSYDMAFMITVFNFIEPVKREEVLKNIRKLLAVKGKLIILDNFPLVVPEYQKNLEYKVVWPITSVHYHLEQAGFEIEEGINVNWVDTSLFHYLGSNLPTYYATKFLDWLTPLVPSRYAKYRLVIAKKVDSYGEKAITPQRTFFRREREIIPQPSY